MGSTTRCVSTQQKPVSNRTIGAMRTTACANDCFHQRSWPLHTEPTTNPNAIPHHVAGEMRTSPNPAGPDPRGQDKRYPTQRGSACANTVATATVAEVWPEGNESNPDSKDGHQCHPPECVNRGPDGR